jgi:hypothetical protein
LALYNKQVIGPRREGVLALDDALKIIALQLHKIAGCIGSEQKVERCVRA